jgi:4-hydroxyphenylpyruvate dioxygenase
MKTSISSLSASDTLEDKLAAFAAAGFDGIEVSEQDFAVQGSTPSEIGQLVRDHGLEVTLLQTALALAGMPDRAHRFSQLERRFDIMAGLDSSLLLLKAPSDPQALGGIDRMAEDLREAAERAALRGLRIGFEARAQARHIRDYRDAWEIIRRADHPALGLVLDSFHVLARGLSPENIRAIPAERIFHVQLADAPAVEMDFDFKSRGFRMLPGEGDLPLLPFLQAVLATGYRGSFGLDLRQDRSRASTRNLALDGHRALITLADAARRTEPRLSLDLPAFPPPSHVEDVAFVEFAASADQAQTLGAMLSCLGFAPMARHKSRAVTLWQQNDIRIVVNSEPTGYAHSAQVMHGTSVCDIGLLVPDAEAAAHRAEALGARRFHQTRQADEMSIPAVRGVGGSVLHFLDYKSDLRQVWQSEFTPLPEAGSTQHAGLRRIDHLAQVMQLNELPGWGQFYAALFDIDKASETRVADAGGPVRSRALQTADGRFRLTMNGVDTHRTFAGRFLSDSYGASVQHIAFQSDDIFATAQALAAKGFAALPIPQSYYDDLASSFDLSDSFVSHLSAANLLYDRDPDGGAFLQLYSTPHGDGFFFEITERRSGYRGYGARNAPYRTAALKRLIRR